MRSFQKVSSHLIWKMETFIEEDTGYRIHCTQDNDTTVPFKVGTLGPHTVLPVATSCSINFPKSHQQSEISSLSKMISVLGKAKSRRAPIWAVEGLNHLGDLMFHQKNSARDVIHEWTCHDKAANHQLPVAAALWMVWIVFVEECPSLTQNLM